MSWSETRDGGPSQQAMDVVRAPDSGGHLTLGRAVDLFLAAKAAEGARLGARSRLWVSETGCLRLGDLRVDGTLKVRGKGSKERIVPVGSTARQGIVRYLGRRGSGQPEDVLFLGRRGPLDGRGIQQLVRRLKTGSG